MENLLLFLLFTDRWRPGGHGHERESHSILFLAKERHAQRAGDPNQREGSDRPLPPSSTHWRHGRQCSSCASARAPPPGALRCWTCLWLLLLCCQSPVRRRGISRSFRTCFASLPISSPSQRFFTNKHTEGTRNKRKSRRQTKNKKVPWRDEGGTCPSRRVMAERNERNRRETVTERIGVYANVCFL